MKNQTLLPEEPGNTPSSEPEFDEYAEHYGRALDQGISISGEDKEYFARRRLDWLAGRLTGLNVRPQMIMDYGCGTGTATPFILETFPGSLMVGVDVSAKSLVAAREAHSGVRSMFMHFDDYTPTGNTDLVFSNGVFHHIPVANRRRCVDYIHTALRPGGIFALWENNPWNPGTRIVMKRIPFDRDAITLSPPESARLLRSAGFEVLRTDFLFIFPRMLSALRPLEPSLSRLPLGAQYCVLAIRR